MVPLSNKSPTGEQSPHEPTKAEIEKAALEMAVFLYDLYVKQGRNKHGSAKR